MDDSTSVPGSLFGNLPIQSNEPTNESSASTQQQPFDGEDDNQSYVDFYARLGGGARRQTATSGTDSRTQEEHTDANEPRRSGLGDDLEASLLANDESETLLPSRLIRSRGWFSTNRNKANFFVICALIILILVMLWWVSGGGRSVDPEPWQPAESFQVSFSLTLASGLEEPGVVMFDKRTNSMRISYYSGMTTFIANNASGLSWAIVPRIDKLTCFVENGVHIQSIFPDIKLFKFTRQRNLVIKPYGAKSYQQDTTKKRKKKPTTVTCDEWTFHATEKEKDYYGTYTFWTTPGTNGVPVRFSFVGHNVILGSSHYDNYTIDYYDYRDLNELGGVDPFWLYPPKGMPCVNISESDGPIKPSQLTRSIQLLFPEHEQLRSSEYQIFANSQSVKEKSSFRKMLFHQTLRLIETHNRDTSKPYSLKLNFMADWTHEERRLYARAGMREEAPQSHCKVEKLQDLLAEASTVTLPQVVDYVKEGLTLPPGEQGTCGSCWAFAATGCIEGQIAKKTQKPPVGLSEQNLMDCSWVNPYKNAACNGGYDYTAYEWVIEHNAGLLATEESYPFLNQDGFCHFDLKRNLVSDGAHAQKGVPRVVECLHVTEAFQDSPNTFNQDELMKAFNYRLYKTGPLSISIDATPHDFYFYSSGIYENQACKADVNSLDHAVLAVGFRLDEAIPYTVIRNNWGVQWGESGYAKISQKNNICGVATAATYVHVEYESLSPTSPPPSNTPTLSPSNQPTEKPTESPTKSPTLPTPLPSRHPAHTDSPTLAPTLPTKSPTSDAPSSPPTFAPSVSPTYSPTSATNSPTTIAPSLLPTSSPSRSPTQFPTIATSLPTSKAPIATSVPSLSPSLRPSFPPTKSPTSLPTVKTESPSSASPTPETSHPTTQPTNHPETSEPTSSPTVLVTVSPQSNSPTSPPS